MFLDVCIWKAKSTRQKSANVKSARILILRCVFVLTWTRILRKFNEKSIYRLRYFVYFHSEKLGYMTWELISQHIYRVMPELKVVIRYFVLRIWGLYIIVFLEFHLMDVKLIKREADVSYFLTTIFGSLGTYFLIILQLLKEEWKQK